MAVLDLNLAVDGELRPVDRLGDVAVDDEQRLPVVLKHLVALRGWRHHERDLVAADGELESLPGRRVAAEQHLLEGKSRSFCHCDHVQPPIPFYRMLWAARS